MAGLSKYNTITDITTEADSLPSWHCVLWQLGAFLAAALWGGQICIWGTRTSDGMIHD